MVEAGFPTAVDQITPAWLTETLQRAGCVVDARVREIRAEPLGVGLGFAGALARLYLTYDAPGGPSSIVAKFASPDPRLREFFHELGSYEHEVRFYREIAPEGGIDVPACYFAEIDPATSEFLLLLEDLEDGEVGDQVSGASVDEARIVLQAMARFHARWWNAERRPELEWLVPSPKFIEDVVTEYRDALSSYRETHGEQFPELVRVATRLGDVIELATEPPRPPLTIIHGDLRQDNIFFRKAGDVRIFDWQLASVDRAGLDVARFLAESLSADVRRAHEDELLDSYHAALREHGVRNYSRRRLRRDYLEGMIQQVGISVIANANLNFEDERGDRLRQVLLGRLEQTVVDLKIMRVLAMGVWLIRALRVGRRIDALWRRVLGRLPGRG